MRYLVTLIAVALTAPSIAQIEDLGFDDFTPPPDIDLVVVRERSYGAGGVDLTPFGIPGVHDFVQSIYVRARHGTTGAFGEVQGRLEFPPGVSILGIIDEAGPLGGSADDGVLTDSDLTFGVGPDPDAYSAPFRGSERVGEAEHICIRPNNTVDFNLLMRRDDVDDFRVIIDFGGAFPAGVGFDVELIVDDALPGAIAHEHGIRVGDSGGMVLGSGDAGEVPGLDGIPLTAGAPAPIPNIGYVFDPTAGILINRVGGPMSNYNLEMWDPNEKVLTTHTRIGAFFSLTRGPGGYLYGSRDNLPGFVMIDLESGQVGTISVPGLEGAVTEVAGYPGGDEIVLAGHVAGVNSDYKVHLVDVATATVTSVVTLAQGTHTGHGGIVWDGTLCHLMSSVGQYARVDFTAGVATQLTPMLIGNGQFRGMDSNAAGTSLYALRAITGTGATSIYEIDVATGAVTPDAILVPSFVQPMDLTRDSAGHLWVIQRTFGLPVAGSLLELDPASWTVVEIHDCAEKWDPNSVIADVAPAPLATAYCQPAVPNSTGRPGAIFAVGSADVADNNLHLRVVDIPAGSVGFIVSGPAMGFVPAPGGSLGNLCLEPGVGIGRHSLQAMNSGTTRSFTVPIDLLNVPRPGGFATMVPGQTWYFQCWHRDFVSAAPASNFTSAVSVTFN